MEFELVLVVTATTAPVVHLQVHVDAASAEVHMQATQERLAHSCEVAVGNSHDVAACSRA